MKFLLKTPSEISAILRSRFDLMAGVQVIPIKGENRTLYHLEHIPFGRRMTMAGLERLCRRIAKTIRAELYGTVNVDFADSGNAGTFSMMVEVEDPSRDPSHDPSRKAERDAN